MKSVPTFSGRAHTKEGSDLVGNWQSRGEQKPEPVFFAFEKLDLITAVSDEYVYVHPYPNTRLLTPR